ncbi:MAG: anthranilate synthase component I family protein [Cyanobacteria bacterium]|nr:anthranilate synthase component I family protein [Cyanobacteriota bacterium]
MGCAESVMAYLSCILDGPLAQASNPIFLARWAERHFEEQSYAVWTPPGWGGQDYHRFQWSSVVVVQQDRDLNRDLSGEEPDSLDLNSHPKNPFQYFAQACAKSEVDLTQGNTWLLLTYQAYQLFEPVLNNLPKRPYPVNQPLYCLVAFEKELRWHAETRILELWAPDDVAESLWRQILDFWQTETSPVNQPPKDSQGSSPQALSTELLLSGWTLSETPESFTTKVSHILNAIQAGEVYQANLSLMLQRRLDLEQESPWALFASILASSTLPYAAPYAMMAKTPWGFLLSNSPEMLVSLETGGTIYSRPIAGTRGRGDTAEEDRTIGETLRQNPKERAEHLMLVDLIRNDLGRICRAGSVDVPELMVLERYPHITHIVSLVRGRLKENTDLYTVLQALFPGGTITGCPKIRCIQLLNKHEDIDRGVYTGSAGTFSMSPDGQSLRSLKSNILIRTLWLSPVVGKMPSLTYDATIHVGAGIVADSVAGDEYRECLRKAQTLLGVLYDRNNGRE